MRATTVWKRMNATRLRKIKPKEPKKICAQDHSSILLGADVVALYPSIDAIGCAELVFEAVMDSKVEFHGIDLDWLSIYLLLTVGEDTLHEYGLREIVPERLNKNLPRLR